MNYDYCEGINHVIREGDTLYNLSRAYEVPLALIMRANPYVDVYNMQVGDEICIPIMPEHEVMPDLPSMPGQGMMPDRPSMPGQGMIPDRPSMPGQGMMPDRPSMPGQGMMPDRPSMPGQGMMPDRPSMPGQGMMPNRPSMPGQETVSDRPVFMPGQGMIPDRPITMPGQANGFQTALITYVIKDEDTLEAVLDRFGIELEDLLKFNNLGGVWLKPGQTLKIPEKEEE